MPPTVLRHSPSKLRALSSSKGPEQFDPPRTSSRVDVLGSLHRQCQLALQERGGVGYLLYKQESHAGEEGTPGVPMDQRGKEQKVGGPLPLQYL